MPDHPLLRLIHPVNVPQSERPFVEDIVGAVLEHAIPPGHPFQARAVLQAERITSARELMNILVLRFHNM